MRLLRTGLNPARKVIRPDTEPEIFKGNHAPLKKKCQAPKRMGSIMSVEIE